MKTYLDKNVYDAACERIEYIFKEFERIYVSFSGGKDSGVMLNLVIDYMRRNNITRKIGVLIVDLEGNYKLTVEYIEKMLDMNKEYIEPYWVCLPINLRNAVSSYEPFWCAWEPGMDDKWIRPMPDHPAVISDQSFFPFYRYRMEFEEFVPEFGKWYAQGKKTACLVGNRSDESLNRFRSIMSESKETHDGHKWTTRVDEHVYNCYPIYDWRTEDIWIANGKFGWEYNRLYDLFYKAGVGLHDMRICQPYGDDQRIGLDLFRVVEPETWARVVNRVSGANFGNIYAGTKAIGYRNVQLPEGHTWRSYTKLLLASLPPDIRANYTERFIKFMRYWNRVGCGLPDEAFDKLPDSAVVTDQITNRGHKNKKIVKYKRIEDHIDGDIESKRYAPTWRRMAMAILKNDHLCKSLSFTQTKNQVERQKKLMEKYKKIEEVDGMIVRKTNKDSDFYSLLGKFLARREVEKEIGYKIYDDDEKTWIIDIENGEVRGFCYVMEKSKGIYSIGSCYVLPDHRNKGVFGGLLIEAQKGINDGKIVVVTRNEVLQKYLKKSGFVEGKKKGSFTEYVKEMKP